MIFINLMVTMSLIAISSKNLLSMWYYMEIASFIFIFYMIKMNNPMKSSVIYFIISFITTLMIFSSIIIMNMNSMEMNMMVNSNQINSSMLTFAFIMKMGSIPFHFWIYKMTENMEWFSLMLLLSIQKLIPIWAISCLSLSKTLFSIIIMNTIIIPMLVLKTSNSFFLITTSSIVNNIWILVSAVCSLMTTIVYSLTYFIVNSNFIFMLKNSNSKIFKNSNPIHSMISILSLMGFPPLPNFFIKLMMLKNMFTNQTNLVFLMIMILISNMMTSIMYVKFILIPIINFKNLYSFKNKKLSKNMTNLIVNLSPFLLLTSFSFN